MNDIIQVLASGLLMGLVYALIALGLTLIWGVVEIVNFSHGDFMMIAMYLVFTLYSFLHLDPLFSLPLVAVAMALIGILVHKLLIRPVLKASMLAQIFITFGLMIFLRGLAQFIWGPNYKVIPNVLISGSAVIGPVHLGWPQLMAGLGAVLGTIGVTWFVQRTETGRGLRATAEDRETAGLMGIDPERMFVWTWAIGIGSLGIAGALLANFFYIFPEVGGVFGLIAFVTVALGGFGSVGGAFVAGIIIGLVQVLSGFFINPAIKDIPVFSIYLLIVILRPQGLLGKF
jgi:branched-chain amino acid transport system permease protein